MNKALLISLLTLSMLFSMGLFSLTKTKSTIKEVPLNTSALLEYEKNSIQIYKDVAPAVVGVSSITLTRDSIFGNEMKIPRGTGSGFIWDEQGHIVTNYHVVHGNNQTEYLISMYGEKKEFKANLIAAYPHKDIAVLKLIKPPKKIISIKIGTSHDLMVGQKAAAIGNPFGFDHSFSVGTLSAKDRKMESITGVKIIGVLQTDAAINPGNSGGPLIDSQGRLIGMNTMIVSKSGSSSGIGFAIPVDTIKRIVPQLIQHGKIVRPALGVLLLDSQYQAYIGIHEGVVIKALIDGSGADKAGLKGMNRSRRGRIYLGDIILEIEGIKVNSLADIFEILETKKIGESVQVKILREEQEKMVNVTLKALEG